VSLLLEKAKQFLQVDKSDGEDADLTYGFDEAFQPAWILHALVSPGYLTADIKTAIGGQTYSIESSILY
jgi:hypothetical protein